MRSLYAKREERIWSMTVTNKLPFLDCTPVSPHASRTQGIPTEVLDHKGLELAESKFGLPGEEKWLSKLVSQSISVS